MTVLPYDLIGLLGISLSLFCYVRVQWRHTYSKTFLYSFLNFMSAVLLAISLLKNWNLASFVSNFIWGLMSLYGFYRCAKDLGQQKVLQPKT
jgi:hypothetical protein